MMYRFYVLKVIFKQNMRASYIESAGHLDCKSRTVDTLLFAK